MDREAELPGQREPGAMRTDDYHVISCATVAEELRRLGVTEERLTVLEFGLHAEPEKLKSELKAAVEAVPGECDILLGYGLCSNAVVSLSSPTHRLVIPKVDDCIALFLGSRAAHMERLRAEPGTYYLTKGWVEAQEGTVAEYERLVERYGPERALKVARVLFVNYTTVALIDTGNYHMDEYRDFARAMAGFLELQFVEIPGSNRMLEMLLAGEWTDEFVVVEPGVEIRFEDFSTQLS
ncbi:MAG: DUF1638 domain-containing protein [Actinobacteria bacterium]|nr:DUF1638 domain-containing protein [Actinomycetota bacterium]MBU1942610.1 DUF1638 domain-containing protein [Actinomycetota bacterium]MBU2688714.1 DUF1638 domain-containing protein [Actinomycetota bacterium]